MAERILRISLEAAFGLPHELLKERIDIIKNKNGEYFSKHTFINKDLKKETVKTRLEISGIDKIIATLSTINVPAFPKHQMGCDGGFTELEIGDYSGRSLFRWWSDPPDGWEELDEITKKIISYCNIEIT
jgi:hypothetical protein